MDARRDIAHHMKQHIEQTEELKMKLSLYNDKRWEKLVWRLHENGHIKQ